MPDQTIVQETLDNNIVDTDFVLYWKAASSVQRRASRASVVGATITGGGAIATGGYTLTVPATGTAAFKTGAPTAGRVASWSDANTVQDAGYAATDVARLSVAQTFAANQRVDALLGVNAAPAAAAQALVASGSASARALRAKAAASPTVAIIEAVNSSDAVAWAAWDDGTVYQYRPNATRVITRLLDIPAIASGQTLNIAINGPAISRTHLTQFAVHCSRSAASGFYGGILGDLVWSSGVSTGTVRQNNLTAYANVTPTLTVTTTTNGVNIALTAAYTNTLDNNGGLIRLISRDAESHTITVTVT